MTILITGATGLIGQELVKLFLEKNYCVHYLSTSLDKLKTESNYKGFYWNPKNNQIDPNAFQNVTTIFNLAGATISKRWTKNYKQEILESRINASKIIYNFLAHNKHTVKHIISSSAIGIYPDSLDKIYDEDNLEVDKSFLGEVVKQWERENQKFNSINIEVSLIRTGIVLSNKFGALVEMIKPIKFGFGAPFGSGKQYQSWIHIFDLVSLFYHIHSNNLFGIYNAVSPHPVTNATLTKEIAKILKRPLWLPNIPKNSMKIILGEMHVLLFSSQNVSALKIIKTGFQFKYASIDKALENLLK